MRFESPTKPHQSVLKSLEPAFEGGNKSVGTDTVSGTKKRSNSTTEETRALTRARKAVQEDAVLASSPAPAKTSKGKATSPAPAKSDKLDVSSIRWMELHNERNGKDGILTDLVKSWIGSSFAIIRCINTKDICAIENWKCGIF